MFLAPTLHGGSHEYIKGKIENISRKRANFAKLTTMDILSEQRYFTTKMTVKTKISRISTTKPGFRITLANPTHHGLNIADGLKNPVQSSITKEVCGRNVRQDRYQKRSETPKIN